MGANRYSRSWAIIASCALGHNASALSCQLAWGVRSINHDVLGPGLQSSFVMMLMTAVVILMN